MGILISKNKTVEKHQIMLFESLPKTTNLLSKKYLKDLTNKNQDFTYYHTLTETYYCFKIDTSNLEKARVSGSQMAKRLKEIKTNTSLSLHVLGGLSTEYVKAFVEGLLLGAYSPALLKSKQEENIHTVHISNEVLPTGDRKEILNICRSVVLTRNLVNLPLSHLNSTTFVKEIKKTFSKTSVEVEVLEYKQIQALKMGGLLAVNQGSLDEPYFVVLKYNNNKKQKNPIALVGKGIVYDTGGLSLKPTENSMDIMKCDMGGAATVVGSVLSLALNDVKKNVIGLIPITDNRPGGNAVAPGDVITMHSGTTVEVMNTDAEGRLVLADALSYVKRFDPLLVIDIATLTGAALRAVGEHGIVYMGNASQQTKNKIEKSGQYSHERLVELPLWEEYGEEIKSPIADLKNIGGVAGAITAGKFLEHFVDYNWLHLDIAGPAFISSDSAYRTKGGTGVGVRLLYHYIKEN